jgi:peptidoglycan/LPS O-acetylase OafA/YrhL
MEVVPEPVHPLAAPVVGLLARYGHYAVAIFIVVSGYCLMLPIVRAGAPGLREGYPAYLLRRARRLMPPYYAALALTLLLIALVPGMRQPTGVRWDVALPAFDPGVLISHLLLVHNVRFDWFQKIDPPMWSLATEWQIYLIFPLLLMLRRRLGMILTIAVAFGLGLAPCYLTQPSTYIASCPWFLGLFALGMAVAGVMGRPGLARALGRFPWGLAAAAGAVAFYYGEAYGGLNALWLDPCLGAATACVLLSCSLRSAGYAFWSGFGRFRALEAGWAVALGIFSYSLYLVHFPVLSLCHLAMRPWGLSATVRVAALVLAGTCACILAAYPFHCAFERPFLRGPRRVDATGPFTGPSGTTASSEPRRGHGLSRTPGSGATPRP